MNKDNKWNIEYKSCLDLGGTKILLTKKYNLFHKVMIKLFFGIKIEDY